MLSKSLSTLAVAVTVAASSLASSVAFAQFPPPPMAPAGPPPMAPAGPPALAASGPAAPGPGPLLGPAAGPRIDLAARGAGGGPAVVGVARTTAVNIGGAGYRYGGEHGHGYGARAAAYAGAYAAGAYAGYGYEGARSNY
ncbi:hypothetical protein [Bradyrhizobium sp. CCBAU 51627]|uniref:hypothetical protein n=1 Tax=Bradyrhizobium sp. CCBAU 51627 TaxID=1325088 RepID=UPI0023058520|nr:hypothetical protein [Bradyrhizobium sp. CCBAU 51627]MDA9430209.1 hypothetical protein [Bradyrhizobium sp. CCBAU 51627]